MKLRYLIFLFIICSSSYAQKNEKGWRSLFNGKDLKGWKQINGTSKYEVKDGMIVGTTTEGSPNSFIATEETFGDFILEAELKIDDGTNSGIQFRSESKADYLEGKVF